MKLRSLFQAMGRLLTATVVALATLSTVAQSTNNSSTSAGDLAWREVQNALQAPPVPSEWKGKEPTKDQIEAYRTEQGRLAGIAADKAKEFLAKYPDHTKATEAKRQYARMLQTAVALGNKARAEELSSLQAERLKDPSTPEAERFRLRAQQLMTEMQSNMKEGDDQMAAYEKVARQLIKEYPKLSDPYQMLLSVAGSSDEKHAKELLKEIAAADVADELKEQAKALAARYERVGQPLEIKFKATNDQEVDLQGMKGKVVLVDFWATWCGPCVKEIPNVRAAYEKLHPKGFEIVGISFDSDRTKLDDFVAKEKMPWVQYFDGKGWGNEFGKKFGINSIPAMWLVDKKGVLRELNARADLEKKVEKYLAEN
jgi:thiol-disulfide isomerase/thioredoxin